MCCIKHIIGDTPLDQSGSGGSRKDTPELTPLYSGSDSQLKLTHYTHLDTIVNKYQNFSWLSSLLDKQYSQEKDGINRNHLLNAMELYHIHNPSSNVITLGRITRFQHCKHLVRYKQCNSCGQLDPFPFSCNDPLCDTCSPNRSNKLRKYQEAIRSMKNPRLISMGIGHLKTLDNSDPSYWYNLIGKLCKWLMDKKRKSHQFYVQSGFVVLHIQSGDFLNFHIIIDCPRYVPVDLLRAKWTALSGRLDLDIRRCTPKLAMDYVTRYLVNLPEYDCTADYIFYAEARFRKRLLSTFGSLYGLKFQKVKQFLWCSRCCCNTEHTFTRTWEYSETIISKLLPYFSEGIP